MVHFGKLICGHCSYQPCSISLCFACLAFSKIQSCRYFTEPFVNSNANSSANSNAIPNKYSCTGIKTGTNGNAIPDTLADTLANTHTNNIDCYSDEFSRAIELPEIREVLHMYKHPPTT